MDPTCSACGAANRPGARFCDACGTPQAAGCPACGTEVRPGARFCDACGTSLTSAAPAAPAAVAEPAPGELRTVSVLFIDLVGYTALSESRDAEDVRALLSRYFETARTIVGRYRGAVEKFIGDAVMAVWGSPVAREDDGERAVRAGLELVEAVTAFGAAVGAPQLRARAGIVTGQAAALVTPGEGLVVGDRVNTAARVQSVAVPGTLYVDEVTRSTASAAVLFEDAGEHSVKGKTEPLRLWRAVRVVGGVGGALREEGISAPFVGRDGELRLLKDVFHQSQERRGVRLVSVTGDAGVGKSRLLAEFGHYVDGLAGGVSWHEGRCLAYGDGVAFWALAQMVRTRLGIEEDEPLDVAAGKLERGLERWVPDPAERAHVLPRLGALLGTAGPGLDRDDLFSGWRLFFERLADADPVVLAFEDLQWADAGLLDFVANLLDWAGPVPILVVALSRPELAERAPDFPPRRAGTTALHLEPLPPATIAGVLAELVEDLPPRVAETIVQRAEGIPLYALETIRSLVDDGSLESHDGRLRVAAELGELAVPSTLISLLTARLDALPAEERGLVKMLSVLGGSFPRAAVAALSDLPEDRLEAVLRELVRKQVLLVRADPLSPDRGQYAFAQGLLRTVAYDLLTKRERGPLHLAAAAHLRNAFPDDGEEVAEVIATHELDALRAAPPEEAAALQPQVIASLRRSAARSTEIGAPEAAARALCAAAELSGGDERLRLLVAAADMEQLAGRFPVAAELLADVREAYAAAGDRREWARLAAPLGRSLDRGGDPTRAKVILLEALEVLDDGSAPERALAELLVLIARTSVFGGTPEAAGPYIERGRELAAVLGEADLLVEAFSAMGYQLSVASRFEEALVIYVGVAELAARIGNERLVAIAVANAGDVVIRAGLPGADAYTERALRIARRLGDAINVEIATANLALTRLEDGRWDDAVTLIDPDDDGGYVQLFPAVVDIRRGDLLTARRRLGHLDHSRASNALDERHAVGVVDALADDAERRDAASAAALVRTLGDAYDDEGLAGEGFRIGYALGVAAALREGDVDGAAGLVTRVEQPPLAMLGAALRAQRVRTRALLDAARSEHDAVEAGLRDALAQLEAIGHRPAVADVQADLAAWLERQGRAEEAAPLWAAADSTAAELGLPPAARPSAVTAAG